MSERPLGRPQDWQERQRAVDTGLSCIVQAPAGSGKTELLVQRILALLAEASAPEEILAITFTRKAAGEMKLRLLQALERGADDQPPAEPHAVETWQRARAVLDRDGAMGWSLLQNPSRLQLTTIDSFCAFLTSRMPWLARFGAQPRVTDDPGELYAQAAEALLSRLEAGGTGQDAAECLLRHLDNRLALLRDLVVAMLGRRDQWLRHLLGTHDENPRELLEHGLQRYVTRALDDLRAALGATMCAELRELADFAAENLAQGDGANPLAILLEEQADDTSLPQWLALAQLLLTTTGELRKSVTKTIGFPADKDPRSREFKERALVLLDALRGDLDAVTALQALRRLPACRYEAGQWQVLAALIELLPLAVVELREVFQQRGVVDFIEIAGAAKAALGTESAPEELLLQLDSRIRHILTDEFQDTSYAQYELLSLLTAGWVSGDGRTLFVVGDPMQSIYRFREAEVGLFLRVRREGLRGLTMENVVLDTNFRSSRALVDWANASFAALFPVVEDDLRGAVSFSPAVAYTAGEARPAVTLHGYVERQDAAEAAQVVALVRQAHGSEPGGKVAVLVRSRGHLAEIVAALKREGLPYQAQDIDPLSGRQAVQDLFALTRALLHPADRVAWLAVLRAPWCGLTLEDLDVLCGQDPRSTVWKLLTTPPDQEEMFVRVSEDGRRRIARIMPALEQGVRGRGRLPLRRLVEATWLAMGGPACVGEADLLDMETFFALLEELDGDAPLRALEERMGKLFAAADPQAGPGLQLMTIHKAKGLEFDTVILPGLGRGVRARERDLLRWLEHPDYELLLAPIPPLLAEDQEPTYRSIGQILKEKDDLETLRLLYVAVTRARKRLHLLGHARPDSSGELRPLAGSLLAAAWPAWGDEFTRLAVLAPQLEEPVQRLASPLRRLAVDWTPPRLAEPPCLVSAPARIASEGGHYRDVASRTRRTEEERVVGTVVHLWLERIAGDGIERWTERDVDGLSGRIRQQLGAAGIPLARLDACLDLVIASLARTLASSRGRWLLGRHRSAACELALNGMIDGQLVRASIDRTFVCADGVRWVVDYKTASPAAGERRDAFMKGELDRYAGQLRLYVALLETLMPGGPPVRAALYFTAFDGWIEAGRLGA